MRMPTNGAISAVSTNLMVSVNLNGPRSQPNSSSSAESKMVTPVAVMPFDRNSVSMPTTATSHGYQDGASRGALLSFIRPPLQTPSPGARQDAMRAHSKDGPGSVLRPGAISLCPTTWPAASAG